MLTAQTTLQQQTQQISTMLELLTKIVNNNK